MNWKDKSYAMNYQSTNCYFVRLFFFCEDSYRINSEKIIFLLGNDEYVVSNEKKQNAYFFSSVDGGKKFKKQTLGNGYLENIHATDDGRNISLIKRVYYDSYNFTKVSQVKIHKRDLT